MRISEISPSNIGSLLASSIATDHEFVTPEGRQARIIEALRQSLPLPLRHLLHRAVFVDTLPIALNDIRPLSFGHESVVYRGVGSDGAELVCKVDRRTRDRALLPKRLGAHETHCAMFGHLVSPMQFVQIAQPYRSAREPVHARIQPYYQPDEDARVCSATIEDQKTLRDGLADGLDRNILPDLIGRRNMFVDVDARIRIVDSTYVYTPELAGWERNKATAVAMLGQLSSAEAAMPSRA